MINSGPREGGTDVRGTTRWKNNGDKSADAAKPESGNNPMKPDKSSGNQEQPGSSAGQPEGKSGDKKGARRRQFSRQRPAERQAGRLRKPAGR